MLQNIPNGGVQRAENLYEDQHHQAMQDARPPNPANNDQRMMQCHQKRDHEHLPSSENGPQAPCTAPDGASGQSVHTDDSERRLQNSSGVDHPWEQGKHKVKSCGPTSTGPGSSKQPGRKGKRKQGRAQSGYSLDGTHAEKEPFLPSDKPGTHFVEDFFFFFFFFFFRFNTEIMK